MTTGPGPTPRGAGTATPGDDYRRQIAKYKRRMRLSIYLTGGLGGIAVYGSGDVAAGVFDDAHVYRAVFFTLTLVAGALLGLGYSGFEGAATNLERLVKDKVVNKTDLFDKKTHPPPTKHDWCFKAGSALVALSGVCLIVATWVTV